MKTYYDEGELLDVELDIRGILACKAYGGKEHKVDNLWARLTDFSKEEANVKNSIKSGLEILSNREFVGNVQKVTRAIFEEYRESVAEGIGNVYHPGANFLMRSAVKKKCDWVARYAALLGILDKDNSVSSRVADFDTSVRALLGIYNNLRLEEEPFANDRSYKAYGTAMENIAENRRNLAKIARESDDKLVKQAATFVEGQSYCVSAAILRAFVYDARQKGTLDRDQLDALEHTRRDLSRKLAEFGTSCSLGRAAMQFYDEGNTVHKIYGATRG